MSTTTERSPESDEGRGRGGAAGGAGRPPRLIHSEATTEIPVHLLFRDDPRDPVGMALPSALPSAVVRGPAARPRVEQGTRGDAGRPGMAPPSPVPVPVLGADADSGSGLDLVERRARVLPGAVGVLAGGVGAAGCVLALWWAGALPRSLPGAAARPGASGIGPAQWAVLAGAGALALFGFGGLARGRVGGAWVLTLFGRYRGSVRRTGLLWVNPLLLRRRVDVRLRHWRSEPMAAVDRSGVALRVVVLVVWRVKDTARAALAVADHQEYLRECVEATAARVLSRLPADAFHDGARGAAEGGPTLRDAEAVGEALTRALAAQAEPVGIEVFSVQPTRIEYAPEVADAMHRRRVAALDARHRDSVLTSVVDSVEDTVARLTTRGLVELDDYERKALVKDLTVAFYTGHGER
ncbi:SPFH domain-containing protein [Streptomyces spectabilis]|uniref:SPFH domain-containing protein n=1 Tax=Streptomyces spectabilis TaxID=68270 RepID=A0A5P2XAZ3_STRST|nr:SPFH domain-containing protein [Streptomyces spectabilis]MBB5106302.1 hypothetical protein [Streptomyces spectabilis]MCI3902915.1 SPFH domain-containing protein [Streptomyces spectabilis]QEV60190.1 SPFH domain-containing protein [Streptomyces spectabilis]GGV33535.1 membrane protein [Streptomyces spectabilis]